MFDRFTDRARKILGVARGLASTNGNMMITPEHLLAAIVDDVSSVASKVLACRLGLNLTTVEAAAKRRFPKGNPEDGISTQLPFTPMARRCLELASEAAAARRHNYVGTEHLLLGLAGNEETLTIAMILAELNLTRQAIIAAVDAEIGAAGAVPSSTPNVAARQNFAAAIEAELDASATAETPLAPPTVAVVGQEAGTYDRIGREEAIANDVVNAMLSAFRNASDAAASSARSTVRSAFIKALGAATRIVEQS